MIDTTDKYFESDAACLVELGFEKLTKFANLDVYARENDRVLVERGKIYRVFLGEPGIILE